jgi:hypothetical protein
MRTKLSLIALTVCALIVTALGTPAEAAESRPQKNLVFILAENEYRAWRTIPEFGQMLEDKYGFHCEYLTSSTDDKDPNRFFIPRMERVKKADLVVVFARRRALPSE